LEQLDEAVWKQAVSIFTKAKRRYATKCRAVIRDNKVPGRLITTVPTPRSFLLAKNLEDTYSNRFRIDLRQEWSQIDDLTPAKRNKLFLYLGMLFSEWSDSNVTIVESTSYSKAHTTHQTIRMDVGRKR